MIILCTAVQQANVIPVLESAVPQYNFEVLVLYLSTTSLVEYNIVPFTPFSIAVVTRLDLTYNKSYCCYTDF